MRRVIRASAALMLLAAFAACSDSNDPGEPQNFTGTYTLVSFAIGTVEIPGSTGTFTMTGTTYEASVSVPGQGAVVDEGTYTATGTASSGTWTQQSSLDETVQYQGTYEWNVSTSELTLDTTRGGVRNVLVLEKQ